MGEPPDPLARLTAEQKALIALRRLQAKLDTLERARTEPIAVIGLGCRFPGADTPDAFWRLLCDGVDSIREVPPGRWDPDAFYDPDPDTPGRMSSRWGGFLDRIDLFDPECFGISPREAARMDPQQRFLLEVAWEALERAGLPLDRLAGSETGVFVGVSANDYGVVQASHPDRIDAYFGSGNALSIVPNRLSYVFDFRGPSIALDTACSSSLVAVHLACQSLRAGECRLALAGGVNLLLSPLPSIAFSKARMLAADGRCKTFDARADGYVRGEGCGVVVLRRLSDAVAEGDAILALIRGSAVNQDGHSTGLTAPNVLAQQAVLRRAQVQAGIAPEQIGYAEAHGTGTSLGDPIEVEALAAVIGRPRPEGCTCALGSVKTNIGHLEAAAGIAGLIKVVLALQHGAIPPHLHFRTLNPHINLANTPFVIPTQLQPWLPGSARRLACVSAFGFGGTNAHVVLEEAPTPGSTPASTTPRLLLLPLSAKSPEALAELARRWADCLEGPARDAATDACHAAAVGRAHFPYRLAVVGSSVTQLADRLRRRAASPPVTPATGPPRVTLLFGVLCLPPGVAAEMRDDLPPWREDLRAWVDMPPHAEDRGQSLDDEAAPPAEAVAVAAAFQAALARRLDRWGIRPAAVAGWGPGALAASVAAGLLDPAEARRLAELLGRLVQQGDGHVAAVVAAEAEATAAALGGAGGVMIAMQRTPRRCLVCGPAEAMEAALLRLHAAGQRTRRLPRQGRPAWPLAGVALASWRAAAESTPVTAPRVAVAGGVPGEGAGAAWRRLADWAVGMDLPAYVAVTRDAPGVCLELGRVHRRLLAAVARLYEAGAELDWSLGEASRPRWPAIAPTYPFQRKRYWFEVDEPDVLPGASTNPPLASPDLAEWLYEVQWSPSAPGDTVEAAVSVSQPRSGSRSWLILTDCGGLGRSLARQIEASRGEATILIDRGEAGDLGSDDGSRVGATAAETFDSLIARALGQGPRECRGVVYLWGLDTPPTADLTAQALRDSQVIGCGGLLHLVQALDRVDWVRTPRLWVVTRGAQPVRPSEAPEPAQAPLWGFGRVIAQENRGSWGGLIDLDPQIAPERDTQAILDVLVDESRDDQVAWRAGLRYVPRLVRRPIPGPGTEYRPENDSSYLITGGLGGLGLEVARWLVGRGARHLVLLGRRAASDAARRSVEAIEATGARVVVAQADVADAGQVARVLDEIRRDLPPLKGIIHAAGVLDDGALGQQTWARWERVLAAKVLGSWHLHELTAGMALDFFVLFSSTASVLGSAGQGSYAAANAFLDALAHRRRAAGLPGLSINWGPWADVGMAAGVARRDQKRWEALGLISIAPDQGTAIFGRLLPLGAAQVVVVSLRWDRFLRGIRPGDEPPLLAELAAAGRSIASGRAEATDRRPDLMRRLDEASPGGRRGLLLDLVGEQVSQVLGLDPSHVPDAAQPISELGMDSLMAVEIRDRLAGTIGRALPTTLLFDYPTIAGLADHLQARLWAPDRAETPEAPAPSDDGRMLSMLGDVERLSEEELDEKIFEITEDLLLVCEADASRRSQGG